MLSYHTCFILTISWSGRQSKISSTTSMGSLINGDGLSMGTAANGDGLSMETAVNGDEPIWHARVEIGRWIRKRFGSFLTTLPTGISSLKSRGDMAVLEEVIRHWREALAQVVFRVMAKRSTFLGKGSRRRGGCLDRKQSKLEPNKPIFQPRDRDRLPDSLSRSCQGHPCTKGHSFEGSKRSSGRRMRPCK